MKAGKFGKLKNRLLNRPKKLYILSPLFWTATYGKYQSTICGHLATFTFTSTGGKKVSHGWYVHYSSTLLWKKKRFERRFLASTSAVLVAKGGFGSTIQLLLESLDRMVVTLLFMRPNLTPVVVSTIYSLLQV